MNPSATARRETAATIDELAACLSCHTPLQGGPALSRLRAYLSAA